MTRGRLIFFFLSAALVFPLVSGGLRGQGGDAERGLYRNLSVFTEVLSLIRRAYVEEVEVGPLMDGALDGTTDSLDAFSVYVPAAGVPRFLAAQTVGSSRSGLLVGKERGVVFVLGLDEQGPAARAGVKVADVLASVGDRSTRKLGLWELEVLLAGEAGTRIPLEVLRQGETSTLDVELGEFPPSVPRLELRDGVGILEIPRFDADSKALVAALLEGFAGDRLIVDVRGASIGSPRVAYEVARLFVQGDLGRLTFRDETLESFRSEEAPVWKGTLVVLVDRATLGPGEILATILRQGAEATLVGETTFGFAGRQELLSLSDGSRLRLTDAFYTGPDGEPLESSLEPDETVRLFGTGLPSEEETGEAEDRILEEGLRVLAEAALRQAA